MTIRQQDANLGVLSKFEDMMSGAVEGSFSRIFRSRLQPIEIQKKLERMMEDNREISANRTYVPNRYEVYLNAEDFSQFASIKATLERDMSKQLQKYGQERRFFFGGGAPRVWLTPSEQVKKRTFRIKAYTFDPSQPAPQTALPQMSDQNAELEEGTAILNIGAKPLTGQQKSAGGSTAYNRPEVTLIVTDYPQTHPKKIIRFNRDVTIGRGLENDVVFEGEQRVSRQHAKIEFKYGQFLLSDPGSTNGTKVNNQPVTQIVLAPGDVISLGGFEIIFQI
jgi:Protein of unknown function (DUF3662)/FHA domain